MKTNQSFPAYGINQHRSISLSPHSFSSTIQPSSTLFVPPPPNIFFFFPFPFFPFHFSFFVLLSHAYLCIAALAFLRFYESFPFVLVFKQIMLIWFRPVSVSSVVPIDLLLNWNLLCSSLC